MFCRLAKRGVQLLEDMATTTNSYCLIFDRFRGKRLELEAEDLSPSDAEIKNKLSCPSSPPHMIPYGGAQTSSTLSQPL